MSEILLVEDDKLQGKTTKGYLESSGYKVIWVEDGKSAIRTVKTRDIDLVVLDFILPDMNGNEVCRWLKLNQDTKGIPIIMLTAQSSPDMSDSERATGASWKETKQCDKIGGWNIRNIEHQRFGNLDTGWDERGECF